MLSFPLSLWMLLLAEFVQYSLIVTVALLEMNNIPGWNVLGLLGDFMLSWNGKFYENVN